MADTISATFLIPQETAAQLIIEFRHEAIQMVVLDRDQWDSDVSRDWQSNGVYLLFGPADDDQAGRYSVYVGKASPGTVAARVNAHVRNREGWDRALLIKRVTYLNTTEVGWLEGRLHEVLTASDFADVSNVTTPGDDTISDWDREALERIVTLIRSVMKVLGFRTDTPEPEKMAAIDAGHPTGIAFDADLFHRVVSLVKPGEWTTYGDVAEVVGTHPRGLGGHIRSCADEAPEWRVLNKRGESQPGFTWRTRPHSGSQLDVLVAEGLRLVDDTRADPATKVDAAELRRRQQAMRSGD